MSRERAVARRALRRIARGAVGDGSNASDEVAVEEPLEIRVAGDVFAVTMRTPGEDRELTLGLLLSEGIIASRDDVGRVFHCGRPGESANVMDVAPGPGFAFDLEHAQLARRGTLMNAACGVCGRASIDDLLARCPRLESGRAIAVELLHASAGLLAARQPYFARTGGLHAALVVDREGNVLAASEDVGRHNATDKVLGALLLAGDVPVPDAASSAAPTLLVVSGRVSFEIVQKAAVARIPIVAGISAPTSLAIDLAERCGLTLAAFVRYERLNLYTHAERIVLALAGP